jgi:HEAT repeat protein
VNEGIVEESWLRCSEYASEFGYFGQFDLLGPRLPVILWCKSGHMMVDEDEKLSRATFVITGGHKLRTCTFGYLERRLEEIDSVREVLARDGHEDGEALLELAESGESSCIRRFAMWKLAQTRSREYEAAYLELLEDNRESLRFEAALGLASLGSPAGGAVLMTGLRDADYFKRARAFRALKELTGDDFGFEPALDAQSQPEATGKFDEWWAQTAKSLRGTGDPDPDD